MTASGCFNYQMGKLFSKSKSKSDTYGTRYEDHAGYTDQLQADTIRRFPACHGDAVTSLTSVSPGICMSGSKDKTVALFDYNSGQVKQRWKGCDKEVTSVVHGSQLGSYYSGSRDQHIYVWMSGCSEPACAFKAHDLVVTTLTLNNDNRLLCSGSRDNWMKVWDVAQGNTCVSQASISRNLITHAKWAHNSNIIAQTGEDKEFKIWDATSLKVIKSFPRKQYIQTCCDVSSDSNYCVTSSNGFQGSGCEATLWDMRGGSAVHEFRGHTETVGACCFLPPAATHRRHLVATSSNDCTVRVWDRDTAECLSCLSLAGSGPLTSLAPYDDGSLCVSSFNNGVYVLKVVTTPSGEVSLIQVAQY